MLHVRPAFAVAQLHGSAHDVDEHAAFALTLVELLREHGGEAPLLGVEAHDVADALAHDALVEGAADVVGSAQLVGAQHRVVGILAGDHDDGDVVDPAVARHAGEHVEAIGAGHDDVEQHDGDAASVLFQARDPRFAAIRLEDLVLVFEHLAQDDAVHLGIVHHQQQRFVELEGVEVVGIGDDEVLATLRLVHKAVRLTYRLLGGATLGQHAADADGEVDVLIPGNGRFGELIAHILQLAREDVGGDAGDDQHELVAAVAHEHIGRSDAAPEHAHGRFDGDIARVMAQRVVDQLEIVQVQNRHAGEHVLIAQVVLVEAPVVSARQRIVIEQLLGKHAASDRVDRLSAHEHARLAVDVHVPSRCAMDLITHEHPMRSGTSIAQDVLAHPAHANARAAVQQTGLLFLDVVFVKEAHNRVDAEQAAHLRFQFVPRHIG